MDAVTGARAGRMSKQYMRKPRVSKLVYFCGVVVIIFVLVTAWSRPLTATPSPRADSHPLEAEIPEDAMARQLDLMDRLETQSSVGRVPEAEQEDVEEAVVASACDGRRVYAYELPASMNTELLERCGGKLVGWINFCKHYRNHGFGAVVNTTEATFRSDWYGTDAYMLEVIYYERMQQYACLTRDASNADLFYIPFFAGLDALPYLYRHDVKAKPQGRELVAWLVQNATATWRRYGGRDHFYVAGRTAWDFSRRLQDRSAWGTTLYANPELENVSSLVLERRPWRDTELPIPYPVGFHPSSCASLESWIAVVKSSPRAYLFSFSGALRPQMSMSIRGILSQQCAEAGSACTRLDCATIKCSHEPEAIYTSLLNATFCLQPRGDTATRRSVIDSIVAGCIPVFFHEDTARTQYRWHLPSDYENFSVFIPEAQMKDGTANVQRLLAAYTAEQVARMRERLIAIMPHVLYRHPMSMDMAMVHSVRDAFDVAVDALAQRVAAFKESRSLPNVVRS